MPANFQVSVVGGGLAGCEAALHLAGAGFDVRLLEMRPNVQTPAHQTGDFAEIVCSNSLKSTAAATASGLLKTEMGMLGCHLLECAAEAAVPAGSALAVDKEVFSKVVTARLLAQKNISVERSEVSNLPEMENHVWLLATGPLTSPDLVSEIGRIAGQPSLHFFDAIAPTVTLDSLDLNILYRAARYEKGDSDYLNAALNESEYNALYEGLITAEKAEVPDFDRNHLFDGCQPIEEIALSGPQSMAFGPLRPVGLNDPRTGERPHAVVQLRQENMAGNLFGLVGFQTRLKFGEQKKVLRTIPGLANAEFVRYGQMHRNFYLDTPRSLNRNFSFPNRKDVFVAGQMTGVEGYVESIASGMVSAKHIIASQQNRIIPFLPRATIIGSLLHSFLFDTTSSRFSPMNANFGLVPDLKQKVRGKRFRKAAKWDRAIDALDQWIKMND